MAKHNITIESGNDWKKVGSSMSTLYRFYNNKLLIMWSHEVYQHEGFSVGDDIIVDCWGGIPDVYKFQYPKNPYKLLRMVWGYVDKIVYSNERYHSIIKSVRKSYLNAVEAVAGSTYGLYSKDTILSDDIIYTELYQGEGVYYKLIYINPNMSLITFKEQMSSLLGTEALSKINYKGEVGILLDKYRKFE